MITFNKPYLTGQELDYIRQAHQDGYLSGNGRFTALCQNWITEYSGCHLALLTHSCTAALEMAAILANIKPGDEIIMPSYTFVSTANAFVLRGGIPVFIDIRQDTLNINESLIEAAITSKTKAIVPVHYAGVACEMDIIMDIAERHNLIVIEDAAQAIMSSYKGRKLGSIGHMATFSFHETKNLSAGEGGALLINDSRFVSRAEIIWEKGTNRKQFFSGDVDKYTWVDLGSSFLPSELTAAFLWAQIEKATEITAKRMDIWNQYHTALETIEPTIRRPSVPKECTHNAHMYYLILRTQEQREEFIQSMADEKIQVVFHYVPLHNSHAGRKYGRTSGSLTHTNDLSKCLIRLPLWIGLSRIEHIVKTISSTLG